MKDLKPAPWTVVPEILGTLRQKNWPHSVTTYNVLNGINELLEKFPDFECHLLTPGGIAEHNATFALAIPFPRYKLHIETLDPDMEGFAQVLVECPQIDWTKSPTISAVHERLFPVLDHLERRLTNKTRFDGHAISFHIGEQDAQKIKVCVPDDVILKPLEIEHAPLINNLWQFGKTPESLLEVQDHIRMRESIGVYQKETGELLAWCLYEEHGGPAVLQVKPEHQRKGYGEIALGTMTKIVAEKGMDPHAYLTLDNTASKGLFTKLGYHSRFRASWTTFYVPKKK